MRCVGVVSEASVEEIYQLVTGVEHPKIFKLVGAP